MYGFEWILIIVGIPLLILNIVIIAKFFQIARNIERLTDLYVYGHKQTYADGDVEYYKIPLERDIEKTDRIKKEESEVQEKINKMQGFYSKK